MADINSKLGAKASTYGWYSQITGSTYDGSQLLAVLNDVVSSGAVFQPAIMPTLAAGFNGVTPAVASQVAAVLKKFTDQGVEVWLRFGHEMNWYVVCIPGFGFVGIELIAGSGPSVRSHLPWQCCSICHGMEEHPRRSCF